MFSSFPYKKTNSFKLKSSSKAFKHESSVINKDINKYITSEKFLELTAKAVSKTIDVDKVISIIDMNNFKKELANEITNAILNKI